MLSNSHNEIWLTLDREDGSVEEGFKIPINPESYSRTEGTNEKTVNIAGIGQMVFKSGIAPETVSFESWFPLNPQPDMEVADSELLKPMEYDSLIHKWKNLSTRPVHLLITNTNVNGYYTISTYEASEEGGDIGGIHYSIVLKKYGSGDNSDGTGSGSGYGLVRRIEVDAYQLPNVPSTYQVQKGDTLQTIAKHFYGTSDMAYEIYKLNTDKLKKGVNTKLKKKWVLNLPNPTT